MVEVSVRTVQGRFLMRPRAKINDLILGVLGRAQAKYGVVIYVFTFLSNHYHMLLNVRDAKQLSRFMGFLDANIAKEVGPIVSWSGHFWGRRYHSAILDPDEATQVERFRYILSNSCKEGLVASPLKWEGVAAVRAICQGRESLHGTWYDRTAAYRARCKGDLERFASRETVRLSPLPCWQHLDSGEQRERARAIVREIELETKSTHRRHRTKPLGMHYVKSRHPHERPESFRRSPAPRFHAATREGRWRLRRVIASIVSAYREAATRLKEGDLGAQFPTGCFPPPRPFVASCAPG